MTEAPDLRPLVGELVRDGANVVWLAGSRARGDAGPYSDLDIGALTGGTKRGRSFRIYADTLTSIVWTTIDATRASFRDPGQVGGSVPGWRSAVLLHDPHNAGAELRDQAHAWSWDDVADRCDRWVAAQFLQLSEEVHKLLNALSENHETNAAIRRNVLVYRLPLVVSVHHRILYDSETRLWDAVGEALGTEWRAHQKEALALAEQPFAQSVAGALGMYVFASNVVRKALSRDHWVVVESTLDHIRRVGQ